MKKDLIILVMLFDGRLHAQYSKLFDFTGVNGSNARGALISDGTFLYGMTLTGGAATNGTIFRINLNGTGDTIIRNFGGDANGGNPYGSLISDGTFLYGVTSFGGNPVCSGGCGVIFKIKPNGTNYTRLAYFMGGSSGFTPEGSLVTDGTYLYGMTYGGYGTIFKIKTDGTGDTVLLNFNGLNGADPTGSLIFDGTYLYGMTQYGGLNAGSVFKIKPDGSGYSNLMNFSSTNGAHPFGDLLYDGASLYGMTSAGGANDSGTIFKMLPDGTGDTVLYNFSGITDGSAPQGSLVYDGTFLYGTTSLGGLNHMGTIFKIKRDGTGYTKLFDFSGIADGSNPTGSLLVQNGCLYGMTTKGGTSGTCGANGCGVIFAYCFNSNKVEELNQNEVKIQIYPNPTSEQFFIDANTLDNLLVDLYDVNGKRVLSKSVIKKSNIDVKTVEKGVYTLTIKTADQLIIRKLVILR